MPLHGSEASLGNLGIERVALQRCGWNLHTARRDVASFRREIQKREKRRLVAGALGLDLALEQDIQFSPEQAVVVGILRPIVGSGLEGVQGSPRQYVAMPAAQA